MSGDQDQPDPLGPALASLVRVVVREVAAELHRLMTAPDTTQATATPLPFRHSADFRSLRWGDTLFSFSPLQAACVGIMWAALESGTADLSQAHILEEAGSFSDRLRDLFAGHPAFGTLIVKGAAKGTFRLTPPTLPL